MKKTLKTDYRRELKFNFGRFFAIMALLGLGAFVLMGLYTTGPIMRESLRQELAHMNAHDLAFHVDQGFDEEDVSLIATIPGKKEEEWIHRLSLLTEEDEHLIEVRSLPKKISLPQVRKGRLPQAPGEILLAQKLEKEGYKIGDVITFDREEDRFALKGTDKLKSYTYTVVGFGNSVFFLNESSQVMSHFGSPLDGFGYILDENFTDEKYQEYLVQYEDTVGIDPTSRTYKDRMTAHKDSFAKVFSGRKEARFSTIIAAYNAEIAKGEEEIEQARSELDDARANLDQAKTDLKEGERKLEDSRSTFRREIENAENQIARGQAELNRNKGKVDEAALAEQKRAFQVKKVEAESALAQLDQNIAALQGQIADLDAQIAQAQSAGDEDASGLVSQRDALKGEVAGLQAQKSQIQGELTAGEAQIAQAEEQLAAAKVQIAQGERDLRDSRAALESSRATGQRKIDDAQSDLAQGRADYEEGAAEFAEEEPEALEDIAQGEEDLARARDIRDILKATSYTITPLDEEMNVNLYIQFSESVDKIVKIIPAFFMFIALMLSSTIMNRLVDEERMQIGTYKMLGYETKDIRRKYMTFGLTAALIGSIIGGLLGNFIVAPSIVEPYSTGYVFEHFAYRYYPYAHLFTIALGLMAIWVVVYFSVRSSLAKNTATLLRPAPPKSGARNALERITPLWRRLSFFQKVTFRNIFRYKKRSFITIFGVIGCIALLILGFGIQTSVESLGSKQFTELIHYQISLLYERALDPKNLAEVETALKEDERVERYITAHLESFTVPNSNGLEDEVSVIVPRDGEDFGSLITLRDRRSGAAIALPDHGAVLSEPLAQMLTLKVGDSLEMKNDEGEIVSVPVAAITEHYAGHNVYMKESTFTEMTGDPYKENAKLIALKGGVDRESFEREYRDNDAVVATISTAFFEDLIGNIRTSILPVVTVILLAGITLAAVILSSLTGINIDERERELSTIKVLGFYPKELTHYIYREVGILSLVGILVGFVVGKLLHFGVIAVLVPDMVMLDPALSARDFILATVITVAISLIVGGFAHYKLKTINMVEALKEAE